MMTETLISNFQNYAALMRASQDKYERLFKIRRDITIESKRIIFLLHSSNVENKKEVLAEAEKRLQCLLNKEFKKIEKEVEGEDPYKYHRVISPGSQEFVEAFILFQYTKDGTHDANSSSDLLSIVSRSDYILGLADLTGELMRRAVSSSVGEIDYIQKLCNFLREVYTNMMQLPYFRELQPKLETMGASVCKVERLLYNIHFMGSQIPQSGLSLVQDIDEGYLE